VGLETQVELGIEPSGERGAVTTAIKRHVRRAPCFGQDLWRRRTFECKVEMPRSDKHVSKYREIPRPAPALGMTGNGVFAVRFFFTRSPDHPTFLCYKSLNSAVSSIKASSRL